MNFADKTIQAATTNLKYLCLNNSNLKQLENIRLENLVSLSIRGMTKIDGKEIVEALKTFGKRLTALQRLHLEFDEEDVSICSFISDCLPTTTFLKELTLLIDDDQKFSHILEKIS